MVRIGKSRTEVMGKEVLREELRNRLSTLMRPEETGDRRGSGLEDSRKGDGLTRDGPSTIRRPRSLRSVRPIPYLVLP